MKIKFLNGPMDGRLQEATQIAPHMLVEFDMDDPRTAVYRFKEFPEGKPRNPIYTFVGFEEPTE